jgi:hypothetical protein
MMNSITNIRPGDLLLRPEALGLLQHVGVVIAPDRVLQNTRASGEHVTTLQGFSGGKPISVRRSDVRPAIVLAGAEAVLANPQPYDPVLNNCTQVNNNFTSIGNAEKIPVNIPEQWVTGFGGTETRLWGGAYDSGQGTTMGPVLASRADNGQWNILYRAPDLGNFSNAIPLLPRPQGYNCTDGDSWVCHAPIPFAPTNDVFGVWTTERIAGGGVEIGDVAMILPTLGFGDRNYANQSYTFGPANLDKSYAYYFRKNANGKYEFLNYDDWPFSYPGENIIGMKIGKLEGRSGLYLFVVRSNAYYYGIYKTGSVVDIFKITTQ